MSESLPDDVIQNENPTPLDAQGRGQDLISNSLGSVPQTKDEEKKALDKFNKPFTSDQTATFTVKPENGPTATVTHQRSLTNTTPGAPKIGGGRIGGYTFTMEKRKIKSP